MAGIDVAKAKAHLCTRLQPAREGERRVSRVETVAATAREILALAGRLIADGVEVVVIESTSDYWRIWYYLLESAGLRVQLVNSRHAPQLAGRDRGLASIYQGAHEAAVTSVTIRIAPRCARFTAECLLQNAWARRYSSSIWLLAVCLEARWNWTGSGGPSTASRSMALR